jgi:hypothetical protein
MFITYLYTKFHIIFLIWHSLLVTTQNLKKIIILLQKLKLIKKHSMVKS